MGTVDRAERTRMIGGHDRAQLTVHNWRADRARASGEGALSHEMHPTPHLRAPVQCGSAWAPRVLLDSKNIKERLRCCTHLIIITTTAIAYVSNN
eukprot:scaffold196139_cov19-Tisochrysis_lutea.AAC.2